MTQWLDEHEQGVWRGLLAIHTALRSRLNAELQQGSGLSLADYDVLVALTDVTERSLRMGELAEVLQWEKSRLSKQLARMSARGLVHRRDCPDDRRGAYIDLTDAGRTAIEAAAPAHVALVRQLVFDVLDPAEIVALGSIYEKVLAALRQ